MRYKRSIPPNRTTDGINNTWCFTFQLTKYHKCNLSHSQTRFLATATSQLQMKITFSKCFLFFPFRTCINFLLLYRVELTYNLIDNRLILIFGLLLDQSDHFITKMCWQQVCFYSFDLTDGRLLVKRMTGAGEKLSFKALCGHAMIFFFNSNFELKI